MTRPLANVTCVAIDGRALLIEGPAGSGKSSLALALIDRGATLVGDDGVTLTMRDGKPWATPPPNIAGKLEVRNVGLIELPTTEAPVALLAVLDSAAPRHCEEPELAQRGGNALPLVRLYPDSPVLPLRAEWALRKHGLP